MYAAKGGLASTCGRVGSKEPRSGGSDGSSFEARARRAVSTSGRLVIIAGRRSPPRIGIQNPPRALPRRGQVVASRTRSLLFCSSCCCPWNSSSHTTCPSYWRRSRAFPWAGRGAPRSPRQSPAHTRRLRTWRRAIAKRPSAASRWRDCPARTSSGCAREPSFSSPRAGRCWCAGPSTRVLRRSASGVRVPDDVVSGGRSVSADGQETVGVSGEERVQRRGE